ncbi:MAG TPA: hypothetical protein PK563_15685, partial [Tenuifilaceae bacterium]|nr:hypothetical protein [Tenuifilaceae bacterium]
MKKFTLTLSSLLWCFIAMSQLPAGFSYQAVVRNFEGQPLVNQEVSIQISLTSDDGTVTHYAESHIVTTSSQGVVSLQIGEGTEVSGDFSSVPWAAGGIYLKVEVNMDGGTDYVELGTTKLQAVPYALFAADGNEGPQGEPGPQGEVGADGLSAYELWLAEGNEGTEADFLTAMKGEKGDQGEPGSIGPQGEPGVDGKTILNGTTNPASSVGVDGDFYLNTSTNEIFGPKASGSWPSTGVSLIGPEGP